MKQMAVALLSLALLAAPLATGQPAVKIPTVGILCAVWCEALDLSVPVDRLPTGRAFVNALLERGHEGAGRT